MSAPNACDPYCGRDDEPEGFLAWSEWARRMSRTHRQYRCPFCGLFTLWRRQF